MHGWLVIDKPVGPGSTEIVSAVKRALRAGSYAKAKVGHGGTLDPLASGVLPVALGEATKLCGRMLDADKEYTFTIAFGVETDTLDGEGVKAAESAIRPTLAEVEAMLPRFTGAIRQVPPAYSALKVDGRRAYDLARSGAEVTLAEREVTVRALQILPELARGGGPRPQGVMEGWRAEPAVCDSSRSDRPPDDPRTGGACSTSNPPPPHFVRSPSPSKLGEDQITLACTVSKGTYIRSLARDIARALGTVGHVAMLRRTRAGPFGLASAISLDKLAELAMARRLEQALLPLAAGLDDIPALPVTPDQARALREGRRVIGTAAKPGLHLAIDRAVPVALVLSDGVELRVERGFNIAMSREDDA